MLNYNSMLVIVPRHLHALVCASDSQEEEEEEEGVEEEVPPPARVDRMRVLGTAMKFRYTTVGAGLLSRHGGVRMVGSADLWRPGSQAAP